MMTSRIDQLFSSDRLRQNWETPLTPTPETERHTRNSAIHAQFQELQRLIEEQFPDAVHRLSRQFVELSEKINQAFPLAVTVDSTDSETKETIIALLEQLDELLWAMSLPKRISL